MKFQPGDWVKFKGLHVVALGLQIKPVEGKLVLADHNTSVKGVMRIYGDIQNMMFLPDGTIYCHPQYGILIGKKETKIEKAKKKATKKTVRKSMKKAT